MVLLCCFDPGMTLLAFKWSGEISWVHYVGDEFLFIGYMIDIGGVSDVVATQVLKSPKTSSEVLF